MSLLVGGGVTKHSRRSLPVPRHCSRAGRPKRLTWVALDPHNVPIPLRGHIGGDGSFLARRRQATVSGRKWLRLLHPREQIESQIDACHLHFGCSFTLHFVKLKFKVLNQRPDNESYPTRIQSFHYGACKSSQRACASLYCFWVPDAPCAHL